MENINTLLIKCKSIFEQYKEKKNIMLNKLESLDNNFKNKIQENLLDSNILNLIYENQNNLLNNFNELKNLSNTNIMNSNSGIDTNEETNKHNGKNESSQSHQLHSFLKKYEKNKNLKIKLSEVLNKDIKKKDTCSDSQTKIEFKPVIKVSPIQYQNAK